MIIERQGFKVITFDQPWEQETFAWTLQTYGPNFFRKHLLKLLAQKTEAKKYIELKEQLDGSDAGPSSAIAWAKGTSDSGTWVDNSISETPDAGNAAGIIVTTPEAGSKAVSPGGKK